MLRDANALDMAYRESFVNSIIPKSFEDVNDKIRFQTYVVYLHSLFYRIAVTNS